MISNEQARPEAGREAPSAEVGPTNPEKREQEPQPVEVAPQEAETASMPAVTIPSVAASPVAPVVSQKDGDLLRVERILEENLFEAYQAMTPPERARFKQRGETAALKIRQLLTHSRLKISQVIRVIWDWLKTVTGVNRFWLQQEAKIKADRVLRLYDEAHLPDNDQTQL